MPSANSDSVALMRFAAEAGDDGAAQSRPRAAVLFVFSLRGCSRRSLSSQARCGRRMLRQRSQKDGMTWARMTQLVDDWLPKPIILHPWPSVRFAVTHPRWEPYAGKPHVRFCAGGAQ